VAQLGFSVPVSFGAAVAKSLWPLVMNFENLHSRSLLPGVASISSSELLIGPH